jgi:F0F1-type ATP synthase membrane subunit b/b'
MAEEADVIGHLLDVEHAASSLLLDAQKEADKRTAEARAKADAQFKEGYAKVTAVLDDEEKSAKQKIDTIHEDSISQYRKSLDSTVKNKAEFNALLDSVLYV